MRLRAVVLTLVIGLCAAGAATAEESGNWLTRWFAAASGKAESEGKAVEVKEANDKAAKQASNRRAASVTKKAEADWLRRSAVCDKVRAIADSTGDEALKQKADRLDQRAWEVYLATKKSIAEPEERQAEPEVKKGSRK
ncbi:MAG TPA: hypothetical protein VFE62_05070 [Gemmataceae bacterium]|nr:hypothetical protein [Gemmataceae bacterium]